MRTTALSLASLLAVSIAVPVLAGPHQDLGTRDGTLLVGTQVSFLVPGSALDCRYKSNCQDLEGISIMDLDVRAELANKLPNNRARFTLSDLTPVGSGTIASWTVCHYSAEDTLLGCYNSGAGGGVGGALHERTTSLRVILQTGAERDFLLYLFAN